MDDNLDKKIQIQKEAILAHLKMNKRSCICTSVGTGKSYMAISRITSYNSQSKILFVGAREIYSENFKKELIKSKNEKWIENITFICTGSLHHYEGEYWDLMINDESHKMTDQLIKSIPKIIATNNNVEILCLTGTPKKYSPLYLYCPISYEKFIDDAIEEQLINDYKITIVKHGLTKKEYSKYLFFYKKWEEFKEDNPIYTGFPSEMSMLKSVLKNLESKEEACKYLLDKYLQQKKTLIYAGTIKQSKKMQIEMFHSQMEESKRWDNYEAFVKGDINWLVNVNSLKEAVSVPGLQYIIIMAADAASDSMQQIVGRALRLVVGQIASIIILCAKNTIEEKWVEKALFKLDQNKIKTIELSSI